MAAILGFLIARTIEFFPWKLGSLYLLKHCWNCCMCVLIFSMKWKEQECGSSTNSILNIRVF